MGEEQNEWIGRRVLCESMSVGRGVREEGWSIDPENEADESRPRQKAIRVGWPWARRESRLDSRDDSPSNTTF